MVGDLVINNGKIITVDENFSIAQAVAVKDGKIIAVGTNDDVASLIGEETQVLDIAGNTMLPGINDGHAHACMFGGTRPPLALNLGYPAVSSISDIADMVGEKTKEVQAGEWIQGFGWDEGYLDECLKDSNRHPTKLDLDPVSPNNPVCLGNMSGHLIWVNSKALEVAGITSDTLTPPGGQIVKDPNTGEPMGIFQELSAMALIMKHVPLWRKDQIREGILATMRELNSLGITSITEPALGPGGNVYMGGLLGSECISVYNDLSNEGKLTTRVNILLLMGEYGKCSLKDLQEGMSSLGEYTSSGNEWVRIAGVKMFADGVPLPDTMTAWMYEDYQGHPGVQGSLVTPGETDEERYNEFINMIVYAHKLGFQVGIHADGGRAIDASIDGFVKAMKEEPGKDLRHYIIHCEFPTEEAAKRMAQHGILANMQPAIKWVASELVESAVGAKASAGEWPMKMLIDAGARVAASSDMPVVYPDWRCGVQYAVLRESRATGKVSGPEQCISVEEAIRSFTIEGAWQDHMEDIKGSIEVGKLADFCIIGEDILTVDPRKIMDIPILKTIVGGKIVYSAD